MDQNREPTVDDLRVKLCYICREEERNDDRPDPPPVWIHPCKCTLVAHESCLLHWISTQQREFDRTRGDLKCPQCGEFYEFEGYNPLILRVLNSANRTLSRYGRVVIGFCAGTIIVSFGAGLYLTCATYGAFAVREFLGPDMFRALLTANPTRWPLHAWVHLPFIPFSLIASRTPYLLFTSPLISLLYPWPTSTPIASQVARGSNSALRLVHPMRLPMWPPSPALVCALFPFVRVLYQRLRARVTRALVQDYIPGPQAAQQQQRQQQDQQQQRQEERLRQLRQLGRQEQLRRGWLQPQQQRQQPQPQEQPNQEQQQRQERHELEQRFQFRVGGEFRLEFTHFINARVPRAAADPPGPAPVAGPAENVAVQQPQQPAQEEQPHADPELQQQNLPDPQEQQPEEQPQPLRQEQEQPQEGQRGEQGERQQQEQRQERAIQAWGDDDFAAIAARVTGAGLGRLVGGALVMPTIARMMGAMLLHLSHVVPLVRIIIAPRLRAAPPTTAAAVGSLVGLWGPAGSVGRLFGGAGNPDGPGVEGGWSVAGLGAKLLSEFLSTSQEWAAGDPVWWRNALGLGLFIVVKDGLKILHLRLAKKELEERHIKNKSFTGVDLTGLDLIERPT